MLTAAQRHQLATVGHVRRPGAIDPTTVADLLERTWAHLADLDIDRYDPGTWPTGDGPEQRQHPQHHRHKGVTVAFPQRRQWLLPHDTWKASRTEATTGCLTAVGPWGGALLVVEGSHRLGPRNQLHQHPWFQHLFDPTPHRPAARIRRHLTEGVEIGGVQVKVVELTGDAGDVHVIAPGVLRSPSTNASSRPRVELERPPMSS